MKFNHNQNTKIEVAIPGLTSGSGGSKWVYTQNLTLPSISRKEITIPVFLSQGNDELEILIRSLESGQVLNSTKIPFNCVREEDYIEASRSVGSSHLRVIIRHVLPNSIYPIFIMASLDIGAVVLTAAALSFLGLGVPEGYAEVSHLSPEQGKRGPRRVAVGLEAGISG